MTELALIDPATLNRQRYIGSSDAAAILNISPWRTPLDVYLDKVEPPRERHTDPNRIRVLNRGLRMEPYVIDMLAEETGLKIIARNNRYIDKEHPFIASEIDAEAETGENIEIKTVSPFKAKEWGEQQTDEIPLHYIAQAQHGLGVTGARTCVFGVLIGGDDFRIYQVDRDDELIQLIREKEVEFWQRIVERRPPDPTKVADQIRLYGKIDTGGAVEATEAIASRFLRLQSIVAQSKELEVEIDQLKEEIQFFMGLDATLLMNGRPVATYKHQRAHKFSESEFKAAFPILHRAFKRSQDSRVFRLKK